MVFFCEASASICVGPRRSHAALCVGPRALCVGFRHSLSLRQAPALSVSGPGPRCVGGRRSPGALCVGRRSLRRAPRSLGPALSRSLCRDLYSPATLCVEPWRSFRPGALRLPSTVCVGPFVSAPALSVSGLSPSLQFGPAVLWGALSASGPAIGALPALSVRARRSLCRVAARRSLSRRSPAAWPGAFCVVSGPAPLTCHLSSGPTRAPSSAILRPRPPAPTGPQLTSAFHPSSPARSLFPEENPKPYCLGDS